MLLEPRKSALFQRDLQNPVPVIVKGEGAYLIDDNGKRYLDASGGPAVSCLGHSHPLVIEEIKRQLDSVAYAYSMFFTTPAIEELSERLVAQAPAGLTKAFFVGSGSEAVEAAMKLARQYFLEIGQPSRRLFIARERSYHGNTLGALALGGDANRRAPYQPLLMDVTHIAPCYEYRGRRADESAEQYGLRVADELEGAIQRLGAENVAAFFCEPVVGASLGCAPPVPGYLKRLREICDRHGVLLILDEVITGFGRTGKRFAFEHSGVTPDLLTLAKGITSGYLPLAATVTTRRVFEAFQSDRDETAKFAQVSTFGGHPCSCAAALANLDIFNSERLWENSARAGAYLAEQLRALNAPAIGEIRAWGLLIGLEMVADRSTRTPLPESEVIRLQRAIRDQGVIVGRNNDTVPGLGNVLTISPPLILTEEEAGIIVSAVRAGLERTGL
jgi:adenosylmethionine-8-amino-7-oxononanoate aminotransferase